MEWVEQAGDYAQQAGEWVSDALDSDQDGHFADDVAERAGLIGGAAVGAALGGVGGAIIGGAVGQFSGPLLNQAVDDLFYSDDE
jgi:phage tail tape-measure protein